MKYFKQASEYSPLINSFKKSCVNLFSPALGSLQINSSIKYNRNKLLPKYWLDYILNIGTYL